MTQRRGILVHPEELDTIWLNDIKEAKINVLGIHPVGGQRAHKTLAAAIERHQTAEFQNMLTQARDMGVTVEYEAHALRYLLPYEQFEKHPEWFRMDAKGERTPKFNMCASNEEALAYLSERTAELTRTLHTGSNRYYWWADDVKDSLCQCPACRRLSASDQMMKITNALHRGVRTFNKEGKTAFLAYQDVMEPPKSVEPADGIFLEYAPIDRNSHRPIGDADCAENAGQIKALKELLILFGTKHSQVLEYWMDNSRFSNWTKPPKAMTLDEEVMRQDVEFYEKLGFESITSFGCYLGADYRELHGRAPVREYGRILRGEK